jgi:arylsulfatase A-like enzyme/Flp pilus assembly protein TadD
MKNRVALAGLVAGLVAACASQPPSRPSVLLITIDTLRADRLGRGLTPSLDRLAAEGMSFEAARANVPLTLPSHATIMTGALPPEHGVRENGAGRLDGARATLARAFAGAGYRTAAFVGAFVLDRRFGLADGFQTYDDRIRRDRLAPYRLEAERRAGEVVNAAIPWISDASASPPFFAWVHLYDPHAPYDPPSEYLQRARGHAYDGEVAYADAEAARLIAAARDRAGPSLVLVVASDHGEGLGHHGEATHGMLAYDSTLRVPLIVSGPGARPGAMDAPATLRDLAPTLLALAGLPIPGGMTGANLFAGQRSEVYAETVYPRAAGWSPLRVLLDGQWKLIQSTSTELYDVVRDPEERVNLVERHASVAAALRARALQLFSSGQVTRSTIDRDAAERLRALGYVGSSPSSALTDAGPNPAEAIDAWNRFETTLSLLNAGRVADALPALRALTAAYPEGRVFHSTLGQALRLAGRPRDAQRIYRRLVARWPDDPHLFHDLSAAARDAGDRQEALGAEQAALALDPGNANAQNGLGLLLADAGRAADAASAFRKAADLDPTNASIWVNLGNARRAMGELAGSNDAYQRALDLDPSQPDAANGVGVVLVQQRRAREAIAWFERALAAEPGFYEARLNLGIALQESGENTKAAEQYRMVIAASPGGSRESKAARTLLAALP